MAKFLDTMDPNDTTPGFKPVPITCPECGNYRDNIKMGMSVKVTQMPRRELYKCRKCGELFNDPPQL